ncbi:hypothetical protein AGMMS49950_08890 [Endomicrobiia bacterium]|nr:hypothetical protein AGMMS49950_08890 [Endomicrobiia bacterium]
MARTPTETSCDLNEMDRVRSIMDLGSGDLDCNIQLTPIG